MSDKSSRWKHLSCILVRLRLNLRPTSKHSWLVTGNWGSWRSRGKRANGLQAPGSTAPSGRCQNCTLTNVSPTASMMYQYFVKIVPTIYVKTDGEVSLNALHPSSTLIWQLNSILSSLLQVLKTNQFSVTRHEKVANGLIGDQGLPGVFVLYELSPMMVKFTEKHR